MAPYRRRRCATGGRLAVLVTYDEDRHVLGAWICQLGDSGWHAAAPGMPGIEACGRLYPVGHLFLAILLPFAQVSPKPWPVGHRPAGSVDGRGAWRNLLVPKQQLGRVGWPSRLWLRDARDAGNETLYPVGHLFRPSCARLPRCRQNPGP